MMSKRNREVVCKLPFVLASYSPEDAKGSLKHIGNFVKVSSTKPVSAFDDVECLRYLNLTDEDPPLNAHDVDVSSPSKKNADKIANDRV